MYFFRSGDIDVHGVFCQLPKSVEAPLAGGKDPDVTPHISNKVQSGKRYGGKSILYGDLPSRWTAIEMLLKGTIIPEMVS